MALQYNAARMSQALMAVEILNRLLAKCHTPLAFIYTCFLWQQQMKMGVPHGVTRMPCPDILYCRARRCWQQVFASGTKTAESMSRPQALHFSAQQCLNSGHCASGRSFFGNQRSAVDNIISMQQISEFAIAPGRRPRAMKPIVWGHSIAAEYYAGTGTVGLIAWQKLIGYLCAALRFLAVTLLLWGSPLRRKYSVLQVPVLKVLCVQRTHLATQWATCCQPETP